MPMPDRSNPEDRSPSERRHGAADRRRPIAFDAIRYPSRNEQALQFLTRFVFEAIGIVYFNHSPEFAPRIFDLWQINAVLVAHMLANAALFAHAWWRPICAPRFRVALWLDIVAVAVCVAADPFTIPPSLLAFIMVVLGNGMRYGMRLFAEAVWGAVVFGTVAMLIRQMNMAEVLSPGVIFLGLFGTIIVIYSYVLMARVERSRNRAETASRTDALTGLLNRHGLQEFGAQVIAQCQSGRAATVLFCDLDDFKRVNDSHGHSAGDRLLADVAGMLLATVRPADLVARYGGDEFVVILMDATHAQAELIAARIRSFNDTWQRERQPSCGISLGLSAIPDNATDLMEVLERADRSLYQDKERRKGGSG